MHPANEFCSGNIHILGASRKIRQQTNTYIYSLIQHHIVTYDTILPNQTDTHS